MGKNKNKTQRTTTVNEKEDVITDTEEIKKLTKPCPFDSSDTMDKFLGTPFKVRTFINYSIRKRV